MYNPLNLTISIISSSRFMALEGMRKLRENNSGIKEHGEDLSVAQTTMLQSMMGQKVARVR